MSLAMCLLGYSLAVAVLAPDALRRATRTGLAPRMSIALWLLAITTVLTAWTGAAGLVAAELMLTGGDVGRVLAGCLAALRAAATGDHGPAVQVGLLVLAAAVALALATVLVRVGHALGRSRSQTRRHADVARLVGQVDHALGAVVVDVPDRLVYAVAGRQHTIVVSRAVLDALDDAQLSAVLAHERAHLAGRHHLFVSVTRALAAGMPQIRLFTAASTEVGRLVEMCADDASARRHGNGALLGALIALSGGPATPRGALGAATTCVVDRAERLMFPPGPDRVRSARRTLGLAMIGLLSGPALALTLTLSRSALCDVALF